MDNNLFSQVQIIRKAYRQVWKQYQLIGPSEMTYDGQVYKVKHDRLMGTRTPFEVRELESLVPLVVDKLYLFDESSMKGLQLLPFITVEESTKHKQKACYIYSKTKNNDTARFVSYHNDIEPEYSPTTSELLGPIFQWIENNGA